MRFAPDAAVKRAASAGDLFAPLLAFKQTLPKSLSESDAAAKPPAAKAHGKRVQARTAEGEDDMLSSLPEAVAAFIPPMLLHTERLPEGIGRGGTSSSSTGTAPSPRKSAGRVRLWLPVAQRKRLRSKISCDRSGIGAAA